MQVNWYIKALEKGKSMLDGRIILACSLLSQNDDVHLSGITGSAMKKQVCYNFRLKIKKLSSNPVNLNCECPAGKSPNTTCKHISVVFLMLESFSQMGEIHVKNSCAQDLQTFHKRRSHYNGPPVKIESLPMRRKQIGILEDPRPEKFLRMEVYADLVLNVMTNYCAYSSQDLALRYDSLGVYSKSIDNAVSWISTTSSMFDFKRR